MGGNYSPLLVNSWAFMIYLNLHHHCCSELSALPSPLPIVFTPDGQDGHTLWRPVVGQGGGVCCCFSEAWLQLPFCYWFGQSPLWFSAIGFLCPSLNATLPASACPLGEFIDSTLSCLLHFGVCKCIWILVFNVKHHSSFKNYAIL